MDKERLDSHILNPYTGCFMLAGIFDGVLGNLFWHLLVIVGYPILLYIVSVAVFAHWMR